MKLQLANNRGVVIIAKRDFPLVQHYRWHLTAGYAYAYAGGGKKHPRMIAMHNLIWESHHGPIPSGCTIDHRNRNKLDNRLRNLTPATPTQQQLNCGWKSSHHPGVRFRPSRSKRPWEAYMTINRRYKYLGSFRTEKKAIQAYNKARMTRYEMATAV